MSKLDFPLIKQLESSINERSRAESRQPVVAKTTSRKRLRVTQVNILLGQQRRLWQRTEKDS